MATTFHRQSGSMLISLMIFVVVSIVILNALVLLVVDSTVVSSNQQTGSAAIKIAESGAENAILRLLRNPSYTGEVLTIGEGTASISIEGSSPIVIRSTGETGEFRRTVEVQVQRINGVLTVLSWQEVK